ncbi:Rad2 nuclease, partial [Coemansia sp. RSA 2399]
IQVMGITGLLPLLREAQRKGHVKEFSGQTVGVDSYIWLYRGAFACASDLAMGNATTKYITFFMNRARMLRHYGVEPYFVFDGGPLPSKRETELERQRNRELRRKQGVELWAKGRRKEAFEMFQRCVEATPEMARAVIVELKAEGFKYVVAPYEADAQLAFLEAQGMITASISEDSDLIVFGCKRIIFKLDQYGEATVFDRARLDKAKAVKIGGWSDSKIRQMCILSGCDYAASVPRVGLKTAYQYTARSTDIRMAVGLMRADGLSVPDGYEDDAVRADLTFRFQHVYDPQTQTMVHVSQPSGADAAPAVNDMPFIGALLEPAVVHAVAMCSIDPFSYLPFGNAIATAAAAAAPSSSSFSSSGTAAALTAEPSCTPAAKSSSPATAKAISRTRSLLNFWAQPTGPKPNNRTPPTASVARPLKQETVAIISNHELQDEEGVVTRFRSKQAARTTVESTGKQSRFFAKPPPPLLPASAASVEPSQYVEASQISSSSSSNNTTAMTETQLSEASQFSINESDDTTSVSLMTTGSAQVVAAAAALSQASTACGGLFDLSSSQLGTKVFAREENSSGSKNAEPDSVLTLGRRDSPPKRNYYLFDSIQNKDSKVPKWAASPVYRKGK